MYRKNFKCDRQSKLDYTASTIYYLMLKMGDKLKSVEFYEYDKEGNLVEFDSPLAYEQSRTDLACFINGKRVNSELKERWQPYNHQSYGKDEDKEGWMLNIDKVDELKKIDGIPLYANLFEDGWVRVWNLNKVPQPTTITKNIAKTTVIKSKKIKQDRYQLWNRDSIIFQRIKGYHSNGKWERGAI